jgi:broad specificity phosphatase PhoE
VQLEPGIVEASFAGAASPAASREILREWLVGGNSEARTAGGETLSQVKARALPAIQARVDRYRAIAKPLVFVAHGALIGAVSPSLFQNISGTAVLDHPLSNTGWIRGEWRGSGLHCTAWPGMAAQTLKG